MSPRRNGNGPPTPRIIIVPASPPTTSSPTTADSDEEERFSPMSISPTSPRTTLIAPPRRFRRLLPAPERPCPPLQPQSQQSQSQPQPQPQQSLQSPQSPQPLQPQQPLQQQPLQQQPHPEPRTTHPLSPAFPPSRPFQIHTFIPSPPPSPPSSPSSPSSPPPPPPRESPPPYSPTTEPPLKRLKPLPLPHSIANLIPPHHNPFSNPKPLPLPPQTTPSLQSKSKLAPLLAHLRTKLHPLVSSTTGQSHPSFPQTLLAFHCLTHAQLDSLARHFHQVYPAVPATEYYPITVPPWVGTEGAAEVDLEVKRRRFGRFIGLRGCESPTLESSGHEGRNAWVEMAERRRRVRGWLERLEIEGFGSGGRRGSGDREGEGVMEEEKEVEEMYLDNGAGVGDGEMPSEERETPEEMLARMAREWDAAMERAKWDSNFALRWKMGG